MICPSCGANLPDGAQFCTACGCALGYAGYAPTPTPQAAPAYTPASSDNGSTFVSPDEHLVATLKNGFSANIVSGEGLLKEDAYVTNKRIYYNSTRGIINKTFVRNVVDIPEVTGTKLVDIRHYGFLILAVLGVLVGIIMAITADISALLPFLSAALVFLICYFVTNKKHLRIEYAGGFIYFSVRKYTMANVQDFQKAIYQQKDQLRR